MPRSPLHALIWSAEQTRYELYVRGQFTQCFRPEDEAAWFTWLEAHHSFAFQGSAGRLNIHKEARARGQHYWYAYHKTSNPTSKRYLSRTTTVTLARLEAVARALNGGHA